VPRVSTKSSKYCGVDWKAEQWRALIGVAGKKEHLDDEADAARAYDSRARQLGYPPNFDQNGVEIDYSA
jgi:hypothetical protein